ncbi:MAG: MoaD/ThiS family protein [Dehalococcoidia bacterium]|jgi:sulfur carrier protein ThiS|nr:protein RnfH [Chloroflexota bacterium]MDP6055700.1 MoaD/ThiS family protein [Dehalococcoidia bacterium]MDP7090915.1 MoaD/ThiS family protein [Dehalococcoidia bacterium]MDP7262359.1 MoaD/ThiS family protein [Dehalococcoidia bacterium]MDP7484817.1 MoaD/ThiS family protein [Dehalococcoidia bacterium]|tara:strand:+ start:1791 stop:2024 length:234 start_codon:yes stop_codon:yes gene_type:complete
MHITVEVLNSADKILPEGGKLATIELPEGSTVGDAMRALGTPDTSQWNAAISGELVYADTVVSDGDSILVFTPIQGG